MFGLERLKALRKKFGSPGVVDQETGEIVQDEFGRELVDPTPMAPPIGYKKQPSMVEMVRNMVRSEHLAREAAMMGKETFEQADDFDIPDDPLDPSTPYENEFDPPVRELVKVGQEEVKRKEAEKKAASSRKSPKKVEDSEPPAGDGDQTDLEDFTNK